MAKSGVILESTGSYKVLWDIVDYNEDECTKTLSLNFISTAMSFPYSYNNQKKLEILGYTDDMLVYSYVDYPSITYNVGNGNSFLTQTIKIPDRVTRFSFFFDVYRVSSGVVQESYPVTQLCDIQNAFTVESGKTKSGIGEQDSPEVGSDDDLEFSWEIINRDVDKDLVYFSYKVRTLTQGYYTNTSATVTFRDTNGTVVATQELFTGLSTKYLFEGDTITTGTFSVSGHVSGSLTPICYMDLVVNASTTGGYVMNINYMRWRYRHIVNETTVSVATSKIGDYPNFMFSKKHASVLSTLTYRFGELSGTIVSNFSGTSYMSWQIPMDFYYQMTTSQSKTCTLTCTSTLKGETLGTSTYSFNISVNEAHDIKPKVDSFTVTPVNGYNGLFVQNISSGSYSVSASANMGATVQSVSVIAGEWNGTSTAVHGTTGITPVIKEVTNLSTYSYPVTPFRVIVTDSRGVSVTNYFYKEAFEYTKPTLRASVGGMNGSGEISIGANGRYHAAKLGNNASAPSNTITVSYRYKKENGSYSSWISMSTYASGVNYDSSAEQTGLDYLSQYIFQVRASDKITTVTSEEITAVSNPVFDWSETDFNFNVPVAAPSLSIPQGGLYVNGVQINFDGVPEEDPTKIVESGTWTPELLDFVHRSSTGWYTRVGNVVTIGWAVRGYGTGSGYTVVIKKGSLPFTPSGEAAGGGVLQGVTFEQNNSFAGYYLFGAGIYPQTEPFNTDGERIGSTLNYCQFSGGEIYSVFSSGTLTYMTN